MTIQSKDVSKWKQGDNIVNKLSIDVSGSYLPKVSFVNCRPIFLKFHQELKRHRHEEKTLKNEDKLVLLFLIFLIQVESSVVSISV